jgi:hypothetical protein
MPQDDASLLSIEDRTREVAAILARGLVRLRRPESSPDSPPALSVEEKSRNELADPPEESVTVHAG